MVGRRSSGFWYTAITRTIDLGSRLAIELGTLLTAIIFYEQYPPPPPIPKRGWRLPHTRLCLRNHEGKVDRTWTVNRLPRRAVHTELGVAIRRYLQFVGLVQYVGEVMKMRRIEVVQLNEDGKIGCINDRVRDEQPVLFMELQECIDKLREAFLDKNNAVMQDFDKLQADRLAFLLTIDYGGFFIDKHKEKMDSFHRDCANILANNMSCNSEMIEMIKEISALEIHHLLFYAEKGYSICYYELELPETP